ncbi:hypothetical protein QFC19_003301 [Naganishia cerealis]|uniref:Uncharacterized protein n=1 Tax=Naganishia cerealis TaxID=610337 RepID=A0ACC2W3J9_9TREE|nr:hypothetical protein QFC19_003301 [Naganishia cerealis]
MRISLNIPTASLLAPPSGTPPLVQLGAKGEMLLLELQGELGYQGDPRGRVVGILDFERMDKPTLHLGKHHLLHGKIVTLPRPVAVIRREVTINTASDTDEDLEAAGGEDEESNTKRQKADQTAPETTTDNAKQLVTPSRPTSAIPSYLQTPTRPRATTGATATTGTVDPFESSPLILVNRQPRDYSSDLSSPFPTPAPPKKRKARDTKENARNAAVGKTERTRSYEVVAIVRKKVVFALR